MKQIAIVIDWYGPYSLEEAKSASKLHFNSGLYMAIGKIKYQKTKSKLQYIGLAKSLEYRLCNGHKKLCMVCTGLQIWLGEIVSNGVSGKKDKATNRLLDLAEWAHIYFADIQLNEKKTSNPPDKPVTVVNRWWKINDTPRIRKVHKDWPELIDYHGLEYGAVVSNGRSRRRITFED